MTLDEHLTRLAAIHQPTPTGCSCGHHEHPEHLALLEATVRHNLTVAAAGWQPGPID